MPIDRPRRIFRSSLRRLPIRTVAVVLGAGLAVALAVSVATRPHHAAVSAMPMGELRAEPEEVAVVDGGTLRLGNRVVRLQGVEPPSHNTCCSAEDRGAEAANALAAMVRDAPVVCRVVGSDGTERPLGMCWAKGTELNTAIVAAGWGRARGDMPALKAAELAAHAKGRGVWARNPAP